MNRNTLLIIIGLALLALAACDDQVDAIYYPRGDTLNPQIVEGLSSVEECRDVVDELARRIGDTSPDYECGVNFQEMSGGIRVYEETVE